MGASDGIIFLGTISSLANSGTITGGTDGVRAETRIASLTNSGRITGGVHAILEEGSVGSSDTVLTLLDGSLIIGAIDLGGGTNTLILGSGSSQALTIEQLDSVSATGGNPFAARVDGVNTLVAVVDPTSVGLRDEGLADLTRGNFGVLGSRQSRVRSGFSGGVGMQLGYAPTQGERAAFDAAMVNERPARAIWGECSAATACRMDRAISLIRQAVLSATLWARTLPIRIR